MLFALILAADANGTRLAQVALPPTGRIAAAVIYWIISFCFELIQARIVAYYGKGDVR